MKNLSLVAPPIRDCTHRRVLSKDFFFLGGLEYIEDVGSSDTPAFTLTGCKFYQFSYSCFLTYPNFKMFRICVGFAASGTEIVVCYTIWILGYRLYTVHIWIGVIKALQI